MKKHFNYKKGILVLAALLALECGWGLYSYLKYRPKNHRILVCISSFKRPIFATAQVHRFMRQTYPHFDISLSVKGVPARLMDEAFLPELAPYLSTGRLKVRMDENKDQLSNLLDTVRDVDLDDYDYFCKVDDDDLYAPVYLEHVNEWLNKVDYTPSISFTRSTKLIRDGKEELSIIQTQSSHLFGPAMCFSREMINAALDVNAHPERVKLYFRGENVVLQHYAKKHEDSFLHRLARAVGREQNRHTPATDIAFGQQFRSVMRNDKYVE